MTKFVSRRGTLGIAVETVRGTPRVPVYWIPNVLMSFKETVVTAREDQGMGNIADSDAVYVTMKMGEGEVESELYDNGLGFILTSILGALPSTGGSYTHTYTLSQTNQQASLSLFWQDPDRSTLFPMAVVESLQMSVEATGKVSWTIAFKSRKGRAWARQTPNFTASGQKFLHQNLDLRLASAVAGLAGATPLSIKSLNLTLNRNTTYDNNMGTVEPDDILGQQLSIEGSINLNLEDDTIKNYMLNNTYRAMRLNLIGSATSSLSMVFPRVDFTEFEPDFTLNEIAKQTIQIKANYDRANALDIISSCVLVNSFASYV
ncbi:hypothetical protein UFOVP585_41 [uncultured Caudovirales phage]|uniref:Uncharacterized protein n=1 Tax=uncultured Caudovirales phage TaxID=2100421 RepID=A0A6J5N190_9CAUD|nr:hypothetical protein UFOVP585_41 [uncultured Caudovirales phage]